MRWNLFNLGLSIYLSTASIFIYILFVCLCVIASHDHKESFGPVRIKKFCPKNYFDLKRKGMDSNIKKLKLLLCMHARSLIYT